MKEERSNEGSRIRKKDESDNTEVELTKGKREVRNNSRISICLTGTQKSGQNDYALRRCRF